MHRRTSWSSWRRAGVGASSATVCRGPPARHGARQRLDRQAQPDAVRRWTDLRRGRRRARRHRRRDPSLGRLTVSAAHSSSPASITWPGGVSSPSRPIFFSVSMASLMTRTGVGTQMPRPVFRIGSTRPRNASERSKTLARDVIADVRVPWGVLVEDEPSGADGTAGLDRHDLPVAARDAVGLIRAGQGGHLALVERTRHDEDRLDGRQPRQIPHTGANPSTGPGRVSVCGRRRVCLVDPPTLGTSPHLLHVCANAVTEARSLLSVHHCHIANRALWCCCISIFGQVKHAPFDSPSGRIRVSN